MNKKIRWNLQSNWLKLFRIGDGAETNKKIKLFTYSIIFGLIISTSFLFGFTNSPFSIFKDGFHNILSNRGTLDRFIYKVALLGFAGIAVGIGFKTGLFNIGVSGQMIMGGFTAFIIALQLGNKVPNGLGQVLVIVISILVGGLTGAFAGALKSYFKIHEVVSTILINWIAWYFMRWMMDPNNSKYLNEYGTNSKDLTDNFRIMIDDFIIIPVLIMLASTALIIWFILYKTSFGHQLKMVGKNKDASKFSGLNDKFLTISSMGISGMVAGLLGVIYYFTINPNQITPRADAIPTEGFDGIAISLIAFSNPIAILPVSLFFAFIHSSVASTTYVNPSFISLSLGVLMYMSSISTVFSYVQVKHWTRRIFLGKDKTNAYENYLFEKSKIHEDYINKISSLTKKSKNYRIDKDKNISKYFDDLNSLKLKYQKNKKAFSKEVA